NLRQIEKEFQFNTQFELTSKIFVKVYDFWIEECQFDPLLPFSSYLFIRMELCGENLRQGMRTFKERFGTIGTRVASPKLAVFILQIIHEVLAALNFLHEKEINLGDLK